MTEWRIKFKRESNGAGWVIYRYGARLWRKPTLPEACDYIRRHGDQRTLRSLRGRVWNGPLE